MAKKATLNIDLTDNQNIYQNTAQDYIVTTKDKIELVLLKTEKALSDKNSWITPLSLTITCVISLITADFKDILLPASVWKALFILSTIIFSIWLFITARIAWKNRKKGNIQDIINRIISESKTEAKTEIKTEDKTEANTSIPHDNISESTKS